MKNYLMKGLLAVGLLIVSFSCSEEIDGAALAKEVCECNEKANGLPSDDPNRRSEQDKCSDLQKSNWDKVKGNTSAEKAFNDAFPCGM